jgi:ankyrin repeat protein
VVPARLPLHRRLPPLVPPLNRATPRPTRQGADSDTAIHLAALYGHTECVRLLLERGARADVADADGALPLHDAAAGGYAAICGLLLDAAPGCTDRGDAEGDTPLHNVRRGRR